MSIASELERLFNLKNGIRNALVDQGIDDAFLHDFENFESDIRSIKSSVTPFAIIHVYYNVGAICTCSDGVTTLVMPDTSGEGIFIVPNAGSWTVSATNGETIKSKVIDITYQFQMETVKINAVYIFAQGAFVAPFGGWTGSDGSAGISNNRTRVTGARGPSSEWPNVDSTWNIASKAAPSTAYLYNLTEFSKIVIIGQANNTDFRLRNSSNTQTLYKSLAYSATDMTYEIDIRSITGTQKIEIHKITSQWGTLLLDAKEMYFDY